MCFSLSHRAGQSWEMEVKAGRQPVQPVTTLPSYIFLNVLFSSSDKAFSCQAKHVILFNRCLGAADLQSGKAAAEEADAHTTVYFIYYLWKVSISGWGVSPAWWGA